MNLALTSTSDQPLGVKYHSTSTFHNGNIQQVLMYNGKTMFVNGPAGERDILVTLTLPIYVFYD